MERVVLNLGGRWLVGKGYKAGYLNYNFKHLAVMSSLLQRRNKQYLDLKTSIASISVLKKAELGHEEREALQTVRECKTSKDLSPYTETTLDNSKLHKMASIPESVDSECLATPRTKGVEYNFTENAFEESYEVREKLGEGAHGVVKRCVHRENGKVSAVKILKMEDEHYRSIKTNFINIRQLKHANIVKYKALYLNPKLRLCHLLMEYTPFAPLRLGMDEPALRLAFYKLLDALTYLHEKGICHRDIKPPNVLCDIDKNALKLIDFGVSKNMKLRGRYEEMLTNTGTCAYKAPEMFLGGSYSEKIDSWAVGISLFELIAGYTPFEDEYHSDTINNIIGKEVAFESKNFAKFSSLAKDLILRLLKKDPRQRLTCEEAKKHLWFVPHLSDIDLMQSAGFGFKPVCRSEESISGLTWLMERRSSVNEIENVTAAKVNKGEKETMKRWLSIINEDAKAHGVYEEKYEFVESENEDENHPFQQGIADPSSLGEIKLEDKDSVATI